MSYDDYPSLTDGFAPHILVVDDDSGLRDLLRQYLSQQGWVVSVAQDAAEARQILHMLWVDMMILDVMMPGENGVQFARALKQSEVKYVPPILMLTAMNEVEDRITGLEAGVDDYLPKPFEPRELVLRMESILRRTFTQKIAAQAVNFGDFVLHMAQKKLMQHDVVVKLTDAEMGLLVALAEAKGEAISREQLLEKVDAIRGGERNVDVQITRLRRRIEADPSHPVYIQTVRGAGYVLRI